MPPTVKVKSDDATTKAGRKAAAERVIGHFGNRLPKDRLLCFFDDEDWQAFKEEVGKANRGFYKPIREDDHGRWGTYAPDYIIDCLFSRTKAQPVFDHFIYLHGSTCRNEVGLTMTCAHELQHFIQHSNMLTLWAANSLIQRSKSAIIALELKAFDIPTEREARIVSKRVAENLFRAEDVREYIDSKIAEPINTDDAADWKFVQGIDTSTPYDLAAETKMIFQRLKRHRSAVQPELEKRLREVKNNPDFSGVDLDALFDEEVA